MKKPRIQRRYYLYLGAFLLSLALVLPFGGSPPESPALSSAHAGFFNDDLEVFEEVVDLVADNYVYAPDYKTLFGAAIEEMIASAKPAGSQLSETSSGKVLETDRGQVSYQISYSRRENMETLRSVYDFLVNNHPESLDEKELEAAGITGMMSSLDPYSLYMNKEDFERSMRDTEGQYGGVGMVITMRDLKLTVVKTIKGSPAAHAGILAQDIITKVDGAEVKGMQINELANKLRGYPNTKVTLEVYRPSTEGTLAMTLVREIISIETVEYKNLGDRTGYLKISGFSKQTNEQLEEAFAQALTDNVSGFILDLRNNPGGLLSQSVKVASHFLKEGELIVYTQGREKDDRQRYHAIYKNSLSRMPVVVLINHSSASASEIVAGSLKDSGKALILGENSYGKGSVQTIFRMSDGSGLRLTTSKYYTPSGIDITTHGIVPEIVVQRDLDAGKEKGGLRNHRKKRELPRFGVTLLKESELKKYLKERGISFDREVDPLVSFAKLVMIQSSPKPSKSHALAKAKELAKDIHY